MITVRPLHTLTLAELQHTAGGYKADHQYKVYTVAEADTLTFTLERIALPAPYVKKFHYTLDEVSRYQRILAHNLSFGAFQAGTLVGLIIAEPHLWNRSLQVHEFHVVPACRQQGLGRRLFTRLVQLAEAGNFRTIVCETQNTNGTAVDIYRRLGFHIAGIDLSFYSNDDYPDGEIALTLRRHLRPAEA